MGSGNFTCIRFKEGVFMKKSIGLGIGLTLLCGCAFITTSNSPMSSSSTGPFVRAELQYFSLFWLFPKNRLQFLIGSLKDQCPQKNVDGISVEILKRHVFVGEYVKLLGSGYCVDPLPPGK